MLDYIVIGATGDCTAMGIEESYRGSTAAVCEISSRNSMPTGGVDPYGEYLKYIEAIIRKEEWKIKWKKDFKVRLYMGKRLKRCSAYPLPAKHTRKTVKGTTPIRRNKQRRRK